MSLSAQHGELAPRLACDTCGGLMPPEDLLLQEERQLWLCRACLAEDESCGCSDDQPPDL